MQIKILILGPSQPAMGGIRTNIDHLINALPKDRFIVLRFNSSSPYYGTDEYLKENFIKKVIRTMKNYISFVHFLLMQKPNLIHINTSFRKYAFLRDALYIFIAKSLNIKTILQIHGGALDEFLMNKPNYIKKITFKILRIPLRILVLSTEQAKAFKNNESNKKVIIVPNMIRINDFNIRSNFKENYNISRDTRLVTFIAAHLYAEKGVWEIMKSIPLVIDNIQNVLFVMVGSGFEEKKLKEYALANNIDKFILFPGHLKRYEIINILNDSDLFVFPTYYSEGFPMVILEAMAAGVPIISTPIRGISEVVEDGVNGFLIQPQDYSTLANKVITLLNDDVLRWQMQENNKQKIRKYDVVEISKMFESIYMDALSY